MKTIKIGDQEISINGSLNFFIGQVASAGLIQTVSKAGNPLDIAVVSFVGSDDNLSAMQNQAGFDEYSLLKGGDIVAFTHGGVDVVPEEKLESGEIAVRGRRNFKNVIPIYAMWESGSLNKPSFFEGRKPSVLVNKRGDMAEEGTGGKGMFGD